MIEIKSIHSTTYLVHVEYVSVNELEEDNDQVLAFVIDGDKYK